MKKVLFTVLAGALAGMTFVPALAEDDADKKFEFNGEVRGRYENLTNYTDQKDEKLQGDAQDDATAATLYRALVGVTGTFEKNVTAHVDLQYNGLLGDQGGFGTAPIPGANNTTTGLNLYQGWVEMGKIGGSDFGARLGRQENTYGTELFLGDNDYNTGLTFDGVRGMWQRGSNDLNFFFYKINETNSSINAAVTDTNFFGATYDWNFKTWGTVGGYWLDLQNLTTEKKFDTYGARWNRGMMTGDKLNMLDWNIEVAMQSGDTGPLTGVTDVSASIFEGWFAYNFKAGDTHGRAHIGVLMTSGDKIVTTGTDTKDEDFNNLFGDFHAYNRFGDMDWVDSASGWGGPHDITDFNLGYEHWFGTEHYLMFAYHMFSATEDYQTSATTTANKIGDEIDLKYGYQYSKNLSFEAMFGIANPDDKAFGFTGVGTDTADTVQRAAIQAKVRW